MCIRDRLQIVQARGIIGEPGPQFRVIGRIVKPSFEAGRQWQGCIKLGMACTSGEVRRFFTVNYRFPIGCVMRRMACQRWNWFSSIQSRDVASRLGRPLAHRCFKALDTRPSIPSTVMAW